MRWLLLFAFSMEREWSVDFFFCRASILNLSAFYRCNGKVYREEREIRKKAYHSMCLYMCVCACACIFVPTTYYRARNIHCKRWASPLNPQLNIMQQQQQQKLSSYVCYFCCWVPVALCCCCAHTDLSGSVRFAVSLPCLALLCFAYTTFHYTHHTVRHSMIYSIVECSIVIWFSVTIRSTLALLQYALCALFFGIKTHNINGILLELLKNSHNKSNYGLSTQLNRNYSLIEL